jgi:NADPH-dependent 2,4-dienoyl-CoA reductase/sulfur reductase-like enzyme
MTRVIVIGGGGAGMTAASQVRRLQKDVDIVVLEQSGFVSYAPCGIPYYIEGLVKQHEALITYSPEFFQQERNIDVHVHSTVEHVDVDAKTATFVEENVRKQLPWDKLVIATGAKPVTPKIPNIGLTNIFTVKFIEDALQIHKATLQANNVVIVGGGYVGVEMAEAFRVQGKTVTVIEMLPHILPSLDPEISEIIAGTLTEHGVTLRLEERVHDFRGTTTVERVTTDTGTYDADLVIIAVGMKPNITLAQDIGVHLGKTGAIDVTPTMETNLPDVYACGDCVETVHRVTGKKTWIPLAPTANKMGYVAGTHLSNGNLEFPGVIGTAFTKTFDLHIERTGLTETEAIHHDLDPTSATITARSRAHYYPNGTELIVKIVADKSSKQLLGVQCVGTEAVTGHVNAVVPLLAVRAEMKDLFFSDFGYAPPFAQVWDPLVIAARVIGFVR